MNRVQVSWLTVAVVLVGAFDVTSAAAETPEWQVNGSSISAGESAGVSSETKAGSLLLLEDMGAVGKPDILCEIAEKGLLLAEGKDEETEATCSKLVDDSGVCGSGSKVTPVHLPWTTQLLEPEERVIVDDATKGTGGAPGWLVDCLSLIGLVEDECTTESGSVLIIKNLESGSVETEFTEEGIGSEANCSVGGGKQGLSAGRIVISSTEGKKIIVNDCFFVAEGPYLTELECLARQNFGSYIPGWEPFS
jgi:hypothetical protein